MNPAPSGGVSRSFPFFCDSSVQNLLKVQVSSGTLILCPRFLRFWKSEFRTFAHLALITSQRFSSKSPPHGEQIAYYSSKPLGNSRKRRSTEPWIGKMDLPFLALVVTRHCELIFSFEAANIEVVLLELYANLSSPFFHG